MRCGIDHDEGCRIDSGKAGRQWHAQFGGCQGVGAKAPRARQTGHRLAHLKVRHTFAHGLNDTGVFRAWHKGQVGFHLVFVLNNEQVGKVQTGGLNSNQDLACLRRRCGHFFPS